MIKGILRLVFGWDVFPILINAACDKKAAYLYDQPSDLSRYQRVCIGDTLGHTKTLPVIADGKPSCKSGDSAFNR